MEYDLSLFVSELRNLMYESPLFPYEEDGAGHLQKHRKTPLHIKDVAFKANETLTLGENTKAFEIGNFIAEQDYPYYHILQDAPIIRKRGKGTDKTKGSQRLVENLGQRDYGKVSFNGKTYSKEYAKNVRGKRQSVIERATRFEYDNKGNRIRINPESLSYKNIHYQYIDRILDVVCPKIATEFGLVYLGKRGTSLSVDYQEQESILDMLASFE